MLDVVEARATALNWTGSYVLAQSRSKEINCSETFRSRRSSSVTKQFSLVNNVPVVLNTSHPQGNRCMDGNDSEGSAMAETRLDSLYFQQR